MFIVALFDKSFFQSLSVDEAVLFDIFFVSNVCPLFYIETLGDLSKESKRRSPEEEVRILADKFPELRGAPNVYHKDLCTANLLGERVRLSQSIVVSHGHVVESRGKIGVNLPPSREYQAFKRWQDKKFLLIEKEFAEHWRERSTAIRSARDRRPFC